MSHKDQSSGPTKWGEQGALSLIQGLVFWVSCASKSAGKGTSFVCIFPLRAKLGLVWRCFRLFYLGEDRRLR